ncbi:hypothetical protein EVAR_14158_1 [Eumeta japonica]|uniref:Uncharacterized protein n=1 Tax=Eumeta variegata TaxID=151549 RepID=A0A4C1UEF2_EUMVA|nr:hypothetical protein EVAR_14158_1 [Eumeta japonica]
MASDVTRSTAPPPVTNAWFRTTLKVVSEPVKEATRDPPKPASAKQKDSSAGPLGEDILTIMSMLKVIKSPEFAQLAADFRQARSGEDRLTAQTPPHYDPKWSSNRCAPRAPGPLLGDSARAESPRDFLCRDAHLAASIGQSRADGIPCRSAATDEVLKVPTYWDYGQRPTNRSFRGFFGP